MAEEIILVNDPAYEKYEKLLLKRDELRKEAFQWNRAYTREFGDLILEVFRKKIECISKKKSIEYCQYFINHGKSIDQDALQEFLRKEMEEYQAKLAEMIKDNDAAKLSERIPESEILKIKKIYRRLVKLVHPDINPAMETNEDLKELWHRLTIAYNCNNLKEMQETEVLINALIARLKLGPLDIKIPDIGKKIGETEAEIERIKNTDPYRYKYIFDDKESVDEKKRSLRNELAEYEEYGKQLDEVLEGFVEKGVTFTWRMN